VVLFTFLFLISSTFKQKMLLPQEILWKLILSVLIGGMIGAEREYRSKSAGFKTLTLICLGATMFTIFSVIIGGPNNPDRIASNIITGIGFVGAGVIFKGDIGVNGITTAAMIWITAALGMGVGAGYELVSFVGALIILLMLLVFGRLEIWIDHIHQTRSYKIICDYQHETMERFETLFHQNHLTFQRSRQMKSGPIITGEWLVKGSEKNHSLFVHTVMNDPTVKTFEF
jgi:putative Mg2+ transporter-C (MgtC) family protein